MDLEMQRPLEIIENYIKECISLEITNNGLLSDINEFKTIFKDIRKIDTPSLWLEIQDITTDKEQLLGYDTRVNLKVPFIIAVICHKPDIYKADHQASDIQARIIETYVKHFKKQINKELGVYCLGFELKRILNDGRLNVSNKQPTAIVKAVEFELIFQINWIKCLNKDNTEE